MLTACASVRFGSGCLKRSRHKRPSCALLQATPAETLKSLLSYGKCAKSHVFPMKNVRNPTFFIGMFVQGERRGKTCLDYAEPQPKVQVHLYE